MAVRSDVPSPDASSARRSADDLPPGIELDQDMAFQRRSWMAQRIAWILMALLIVAALLGVAGGGGPLARSWAGGDAEGVIVEYPRFVRRAAPTPLQLRLEPGTGERVEIAFSDAFAGDLEIAQVRPEPVAWRAGPQGSVLAFMRQSGEPAVLVLDVRARALGRLRATVVVAGRPPVSPTLFAWP